MSATSADLEKTGNLPVTPRLILLGKYIILDMSEIYFTKTRLTQVLLLEDLHLCALY